MFNLVHKQKRIAQIILALLIVPFAFFGLDSYFRGGGGKDDLATVNGSPITQREFAEALRQQQERLRQAFGPNADPAALDTPESRRALLESLIHQHLVADAALRAGLTVSDASLRETIAAAPAFQSGGKFSMDIYEAMLRAQGMTREGFEQRLRQEFLISQLVDAVSGTAVMSRSVAERLAEMLGERRELREALVSVQPYLAEAQVGEAQVKAYFDAHPDEFTDAERVRAEYLVLSVDALRERAAVPEADLKAAYDSRASQYGVPEQRRASHILVKTREEADKIVAEARRNPARFAELARKYSQDPGSASKGGDLGYFAKGTMVPAFEQAAFQQKEGAIGDPVQSDFGWHVIRVTGIQPATVKPFSAVRAELADELSRQQAQRRFAELAESFTNSVYEQSDSLKPAAERFKLPLRTSGWITRSANSDAGVLSNPKLLAALFADDTVKARRNTDAIEVSPGVLVSARVLEHQAASQRKFGDVRADIERRLRQEEALRLAQKAGEEKLAVLRKGGEAGLTWGPAKSVSRRSAQGVPAGALRPLLAADSAKLPAFAGAARGSDGYMLYRVDKVLEPEARPEAQRQAERARLEQLAGTGQMEAFVSGLRAKADIEIHPANLEKRP
ncbi:MAG TPA: SurA N-terminal domain-containing protein [Burkholderiales bacterium]|nr:SurA N-terminal domain-containing protein [Burkholderiales bacterium]